MSKKGYKQTEEHKMKISKATVGRLASSGSFKKGHVGYKANLGKSLSGETKKKISNAKKLSYQNNPDLRKKISQSRKGKGLKNTNGFKKGQIPWNKGKKTGIQPWLGKKRPNLHSEETKKRMSERSKGEKNYFWKGGISFEPYEIEFSNQLKKQVRKRDNYRCQECFRHQDELYAKSGRKYKLHIHHIDYDKKNNNPNNLISLCRNCHLQTNYTRENWTYYFKKSTTSTSCE